MMHRTQRRFVTPFVEPLEPRTFLSTTPIRSDTSLDSSWRFHKGSVTGASAPNFVDASWSAASVPHTWNALDGEDGGNNYYRGVGWYRRHFTVPSSASNQEIFLKFDGVDITASVYVNGILVGSHAGGYTAFTFDVTPDVHFGADNVLAVVANNSAGLQVAPLTADYTFFGGIYRDVHLIITDKVHIDLLNSGSSGVFLSTPSVSATSALLTVTTDVRNDLTTAQTVTVRAQVLDATGKLVATFNKSQLIAAKSTAVVVESGTIANPHLWNGTADPYQYSVADSIITGTIVHDTVTQPLGFRWFSVSPTAGFFLNGHYLDLHGVDLHQDRLDKGWAISAADTTQDISLVQQIGATAVRLSHYPHSQLTYDLLDQDGIVAWSEIPLVNGINSSSAFAANAEQQLREMILQNFNHPSVIFWGIFNELSNSPNPDANPLVGTLNSEAHSLDPGRLTTAASNADPSSALSTHTDVIGFNRYDGWYYSTASNAGKTLDLIHKTLPNRAIAISEFGAGASIYQHTATPTQPSPGGKSHPEEYQALFAEAWWGALSTRPFVWGKFVWNLFDFASDSRNEGDTPGRNDKGLITYDRKTKKDAFYFFQANWSSSPVLYITDRRFASRTIATTDVKIYSNTRWVMLSVNGKTISTLENGVNGVLTWKGVQLAPGSNTIKVTGWRNGQLYTDTCAWTVGTPAAG